MTHFSRQPIGFLFPSLFAPLLLASLTACSPIQLFQPQPPIQRREYSFSTPTTKPNPKIPPLQVLFLLSSPQASQREFLLRTSNNTWQIDPYGSFTLPPAELITQIARQRYQSNLHPSLNTFRLEGEILDIYGDFSDPTHPKAVLSIQFALKKEPEQLIFQRTFSSACPINPTSRAGMVSAWSSALAEIFNTLDREIQNNIHSANF
ncbi:MAG: hypothetical protein N2035_08045 [Chthoniobacterales bacterium]|nr:hypothetical protein [Chthoniobacterales bacterium]